MAVSANSRLIAFQGAQRSKLVNDNMNDKDAEVNDLQAQINNILTAPAGNEVTNARDYHVVLRDRLRSVSQGHENQIITGFEVIEQDTPNMTVKVKAGEAVVKGVGTIKGFGTWTRSGITVTITELNHGLSNGNKIYIDTTSNATALPLGEKTVSNVSTNTFDVTGGASGDTSGTCDYSRYSGTITAAAANKHRIDIVVIDSSNTISIVIGSEFLKASQEIIPPAITDTQLPLAYIYINDNTTTIIDEYINAINVITANDSPDKLISGGVVTEQGTPNMTCQISAGTAIINNKFVTWGLTNLDGITIPSANPRLDYICIDDLGIIFREIGTEAASPVFPSIPANCLVIGALVTKTGTTSINTGQECFTFKNANNPYFPNLYINAAYTATNKSHGNVIIDMSNAVITGTLQAQGNVWIVNYDNADVDGSGETLAEFSNLGGEPTYTSDTIWRIQVRNRDGLTSNNPGSTLNGSGGGATAAVNPKGYCGNAATARGGNIEINAFNIYIYDLDLSGGNGGNGSTGYDPNDHDAAYPDNKFEVGATGRNAESGHNVVLEAINEINLLLNGIIDLSGGDGGDGSNASNGTVGNLGGDSGSGGNSGDLSMTAKTIIENGTSILTGGSVGTVGTGSGGSDNNANGTAGSAGSTGTKTSTTYDFTDGLPAGYADWINPLFMEGIA